MAVHFDFRFALRFVFAVLILAGLFSCSGANAQTFRGGICGAITDPSGAFVANAQVTAKDNATGLTYKTISSTAGEYGFQDLPIGLYAVSVHKEGFEDFVADKAPIEAGAVYSLPVRLKIASVESALVITANALTVETATTTEANVLDAATVEGTPLNGRDFTQLLALSPGYSGYTVGFLGAINGTQASQVNWQIEGADNNDLWNNTSAVNQGGVYGVPGVLLPLDSVEEFSLVTQGNA